MYTLHKITIQRYFITCFRSQWPVTYEHSLHCYYDELCRLPRLHLQFWTTQSSVYHINFHHLYSDNRCKKSSISGSSLKGATDWDGFTYILLGMVIANGRGTEMDMPGKWGRYGLGVPNGDIWWGLGTGDNGEWSGDLYGDRGERRRIGGVPGGVLAPEGPG